MADENGSPPPFRRERNLSNRNFNKRGSRRRVSTDSRTSVDSVSLASESQSEVSQTQSQSQSHTHSLSLTDTNSAGIYVLSEGSSSLNISYSVNSDTEHGFAEKSLRMMVPPAHPPPPIPRTNSEEPQENAEQNNGEHDDEEVQSPDPAWLGVKQKVLRFETLQAEDRIIFKTGKYRLRAQQLQRNANSRDYGPLRVLPVLQKHNPIADNEASMSSVSHSFQNSIDEERSEDDVDDFSDYAEDGEDTAVMPTAVSGDFVVAEEAREVEENITPSPLPGFYNENCAVNGDGVRSDVPELGIDDFGKVETVRRSSSAENCREAALAVANACVASSPPSPSAISMQMNSTHSSEAAPQRPTPPNRKGSKDFPRNYRSRPKTEVIGTKNKSLISKYNSVYQPNDGEDERAEDDTGAPEEQAELRNKSAKFIHPILEELIKTEETYVDNLEIGIRNYGNIFQRKDLPLGLRGKKFILLGNIEQIAEFHRDEFLPMLHRNRRDLKRLFGEFLQLIEQNCFYPYVIFTMNKQRSLKLCDVYKNYFKLIQTELDDKLGINSFLVQPIQRMARYPLLLQQFITTLFKNRDFVMKPLIEACCRLEKKFRTLLTTTNESEIINDIVDCNDFNVFYQGKFQKVSEFQVFDHTLKRSYRSKVFIFDKCIIYTEIKGKSLIFHGRYPCEHVGIMAKAKSFTLFYERRKQQECDFSADPAQIEMWLDLIRDMLNSYAAEERVKLQDRYARENDHLHYKAPSLSLFRDSNRFSSDSGIGNIWVLPKLEQGAIEATGAGTGTGNRTTWYGMP